MPNGYSIGLRNDKVMHGGSDALRIFAERSSIAGPAQAMLLFDATTVCM
jgi:hypothetical protein